MADYSHRRLLLLSVRGYILSAAGVPWMG